jgi:hypothetical protein
MTCSTSIEEMLSRPVRMTFIRYEAEQASCVEECRWPEESHERVYWLKVFAQKKSPRLSPRALIPHQRDVEAATAEATEPTH